MRGKWYKTLWPKKVNNLKCAFMRKELSAFPNCGLHGDKLLSRSATTDCLSVGSTDAPGFPKLVAFSERGKGGGD
jgi:hypothetical protein